MLQSNFQEGEELSLNGKVTINLPEDNPTAFAILMSVIHGLTMAVPRGVDLSTLAELAILVDKYDMYKSTKRIAELWIKVLKDEIPIRMCEDLMVWMAITYVFRTPCEFKQVTLVARLHSTSKHFPFKKGSRFSESLPIPERIFG